MTEVWFNNLVYLKLLLSVDGLGPLKILSLFKHFGNLQFIFNAHLNDLTQANGISTTLSKKIINAKTNYNVTKDKVEQELKSLKKINARIVTYWDNDYPDILKRIYYPPIILYIIGNFSEQDNSAIAIVGTRQPTNYGKQQAEKFARELSEKYITIVSGMARGIDSIVHQSVLKTNGRTIAVIGSGLDVIYPPENKKLFREIAESGVVISEYELGTKPDAQNFPKRNRIISGLSLGTLVVETRINGGAMQTAAYAIDQNREVFAIPGNVNSKQSEGPNSLIQRGEAKLVLTEEDLLNELKIKLKPEIGISIPKPSVELNLFEEKLITVLSNDAKHIDDIAAISSMSISDCLVNLLTLEFKGLVKQLPGKMFTLH